MKKLFLLFFVTLFLSSCERGCQSWNRSFESTSSHKLHITLFSGGEAVKEWTFSGIVNNQEGTDGFYFYYEGKLVEVSGDVLIEYLD